MQALTERRGRKRRRSPTCSATSTSRSTAFTTLSGFALDGMTRDPGWRFLSIGRRLERLQSLCTLAAAHALAGPRRDATSTWLLRLADSIITYRARYMARPEWLPVLDLLIRDEANPRSIAFQVHRAARLRAAALMELFGELRRRALRTARCAGCCRHRPGDRPAAGQRAARSRCSTNGRQPPAGIGEQLSLRFFSHVGEASRQTFAT